MSVTMNFYKRWILPRLTHLTMRQRALAIYRQRALVHARGEVLEIGMGSGLNLPFYSHQVTRILGVEPSQPLAAMTREAAKTARMPVSVLEQSAEELPLSDCSIDTAVTTWTLCTIPDPRKALCEVRRVLKPDGRLVFVEHGLAPDPGVVRWQRRLTPAWKYCAGGCHLDRPIADLIRGAGFQTTELTTGYMNNRKSIAFMYGGTAVAS